MDLCYLLRGYQLSQSAILVYGVLEGLSRASAARGKPYTYISRKAIGERIGRSERTAQRAVKELEQAGLVAVKRRGRTLNDHIFVFPPQMPEGEKEGKVKAADHSIYGAVTAPAPSSQAPSMAYQGPSKMSCHINNTQKINKNKDLSILPVNDDEKSHEEVKGKGRPTPKRPRLSPEERQKVKNRYRDYLRERLEFEALRRDIVIPFEDADALAKIIDLIANAMAAKGKIAVNGVLLSPSEYWYVVKNLTQESALNIIYKQANFKNVKNPRAYLLATLYNEALQDVLSRPYYSYNC